MEKLRDKPYDFNNIDAWSYDLTWYTRGHKNILVEEVEKRVEELLIDLCVDIKMNLIQVELTPDSIRLLLGSKGQVNITKVLKMIQKRLSKSLFKKFPRLKEIGTELWDSRYLSSSINNDQSEVDIRIEKVLDSLWSVEYYDLDEGVTDDLGEFKNYLIGRKLGIVDDGERVFLIDEEALAKEINLNCFECTKIYKYGCCAGSPCDLSSKNKNMFDKHVLKIASEVKALDESYYNDIVAKGGFVSPEGAITECGGRCSLLVEHEGVYKCIAHKYALDQNIPIYELCPLSCLMYPLEIVELITDKQKKIILLTSVVEEDFAKEFGRWGSYKSLDVDLRCINKDKHNEIFKEKDYKPVYRVNKNLLIHEFGTRIYSGIESLMR